MGFWDGKTILVTGGAGFLGSYVTEGLVHRVGVNPGNIRIPSSKDTDLRRWEDCLAIAKDVDIVIHLAARVGGIGFNRKFPASLFYDNAMIGLQMMEAARLREVAKFVAIGTVCAYPKFTPIPFHEADLWNGYPEETNAPYGFAKKMLLIQSQAYREQYGFNSIYLLPVNLYGPRDNFDPQQSHVIPSLIRKMVEAERNRAPEIVVWGSGKPTREFLYAEDAAEGIILATELYDDGKPVNLGSGEEISISSLVALIKEITGFKGMVKWDETMPDGQPRRCLDTSRARETFGFTAKTKLADGLRKTIEWYRGKSSSI